MSAVAITHRVKETEHLSCDHQTLFVFSADRKILTIKTMAIDDAEMKRGRQDYCWKTVATYKAA
jgi:hypothetical protein